MAGRLPCPSPVQVHATAAAIIKRGWLENAGEEQAAALHAIHSIASRHGTAEARRAGLQLLVAVVEEFSPATASTMGLSWWVAPLPRRQQGSARRWASGSPVHVARGRQQQQVAGGMLEV